jgi:hypothetical protein
MRGSFLLHRLQVEIMKILHYKIDHYGYKISVVVWYRQKPKFGKR